MKKPGKKKILLLSRSVEVYESLDRALKGAFHVRVARSKGEALKSLVKDKPDICIIDLHIPRIDPFKLSGELRDLHPRVGVIALSEKGEHDLTERALKSGVDACTPYDFGDGEFRLLLTRVLNSSSSRSTLTRGEGEPQEASELLQHLIDSSPDAIISTDAAGNVRIYSKGSTHIFGYSPREILHKPVARLFAKGHEEMLRILKLLQTRGKLESYKVDFLRKDGRRIICILSGSPLRYPQRKGSGYLFVIKDITDSIKLEKEIYESKIELESVFDSIVDPLAVIRKDSTISRANRATAKLVGMEIREVIGRKCHELLHCSKIKCDPCPVRETYRTGRSSFSEIEAREIGEIFHVYCYPILDYHGSVKGVIEHRRTVTEQKKLEAERHRLELELMEKHKLSSVGMLAQGIAHNLNTPLGVIMGRSELLKDDVERALLRAAECLENSDDPEGARREIDAARQQSTHILEIILKQVDTMSSIIRNLMDIGRQRQDAARKKLNINHVLEQEMRFLEADMFFKHDVTRIVELDPGMPYIEGVYSDFSQSFTNLIRNAMDAMYDRPLKELRVRTYHDDEWIYVEIHDTGEGITKANLPKIFDPFFTTKDFGGAVGKPAGVGLGLHSCYQLLSPYGVKFNVESSPGDTTFTIQIPVRGEQS